MPAGPDIRTIWERDSDSVMVNNIIARRNDWPVITATQQPRQTFPHRLDVYIAGDMHTPRFPLFYYRTIKARWRPRPKGLSQSMKWNLSGLFMYAKEWIYKYLLTSKRFSVKRSL